MKLLMTADVVGGVWQYATELAVALAPQGVETVLTLLGPVPDGLAAPAGVEVIDTGLPLDWLAEDAAAVRDAAAKVAALAGRIGADLVQLNSPSLAAGARFPCPVVTVTHGCVGTWWDAAEGGDLPPDLAWRLDLTAQGLAAADLVVAPSASYAETVTRRYRLARPIVTVHNGRTTPASRLPCQPAQHVLTTGRLWDRVKNTALLDRVAARLPVPFLAAGPVTGPHGEAVATRHLDLLGTLPEAALRARLAERPIFVSAARFEPFGLAVLEAAQAGCALVLADLPTFRELWEGAALFIAGEDDAVWTAAIESLLAAPAERAALADAAQQRAGRYTPAATAAAMARLYDGLLGQGRRAAA
jgi:glycosyltransferase involved in cell wall biosynthesis